MNEFSVFMVHLCFRIFAKILLFGFCVNTMTSVVLFPELLISPTKWISCWLYYHFICEIVYVGMDRLIICEVVVNIRKWRLLLWLPSTLQKIGFGFSSLELGTERPPRKPPWVIFGWVCLASIEFCFSICVIFVGLVLLMLFCVLCFVFKFSWF
jgi:hypothetical protein